MPLSGLSVPPPGAQDQLHCPGHDGQQSLRLRVRLSGERAQVLRDQDGEGGRAGGGGHEGPVPGGLRDEEERNRRGQAEHGIREFDEREYNISFL